MSQQPTAPSRRQRIALAAITGLVAGVVRAVIAWGLDQLVSHL